MIDGLLYNLLMLTAWVVGASTLTLAVLVTWAVLATIYDLILKRIYYRRVRKGRRAK